jgi:hypothetical protein
MVQGSLHVRSSRHRSVFPHPYFLRCETVKLDTTEQMTSVWILVRRTQAKEKLLPCGGMAGRQQPPTNCCRTDIIPLFQQLAQGEVNHQWHLPLAQKYSTRQTSPSRPSTHPPAPNRGTTVGRVCMLPRCSVHVKPPNPLVLSHTCKLGTLSSAESTPRIEGCDWASGLR